MGNYQAKEDINHKFKKVEEVEESPIFYLFFDFFDLAVKYSYKCVFRVYKVLVSSFEISVVLL
jgi:hypothetical protein